jgi:hybrid cluster-associated redox disulfide protein
MPELEMTVAEVLGRWPQCAAALNEARMACVGCELSSFETLADAAQVYGVGAGQLLTDLRRAASHGPGSSSSGETGFAAGG